MFVFGVFYVAVGSKRADVLAVAPLIIKYLPDFLRGLITVLVVKNVTQGRKIILALCAVYAVIDCNEADAVLWENHFTDMDKTTKIMGRGC